MRRSEHIKRCRHARYWDEPPQCSSCYAYICGNCHVAVAYPIELCATCADCDAIEFKRKQARHFGIVRVDRPT